MKLKPDANIQDVLETYEGIAAELTEAAKTATGRVLGWDNNLAIRITDKGPVACGILHADTFESYPGYSIHNGNGEYARLLDRKTVLERAAQGAREAADMLRQHLPVVS